MNVEVGDFKTLKVFLQSKGIDETDLGNLEKALQSDPPNPLNGCLGENTANWIADLTKRSLMGTLKSGRDIAVALIAQAIAHYYGWS